MIRINYVNWCLSMQLIIINAIVRSETVIGRIHVGRFINAN